MASKFPPFVVSVGMVGQGTLDSFVTTIGCIRGENAWVPEYTYVNEQIAATSHLYCAHSEDVIVIGIGELLLRSTDFGSTWEVTRHYPTTHGGTYSAYLLIGLVYDGSLFHAYISVNRVVAPWTVVTFTVDITSTDGADWEDPDGGGLVFWGDKAPTEQPGSELPYDFFPRGFCVDENGVVHGLSSAFQQIVSRPPEGIYAYDSRRPLLARLYLVEYYLITGVDDHCASFASRGKIYGSTGSLKHWWHDGGGWNSYSNATEGVGWYTPIWLDYDGLRRYPKLSTGSPLLVSTDWMTASPPTWVSKGTTTGYAGNVIAHSDALCETDRMTIGHDIGYVYYVKTLLMRVLDDRIWRYFPHAMILTGEDVGTTWVRPQLGGWFPYSQTANRSFWW